MGDGIGCHVMPGCIAGEGKGEYESRDVCDAVWVSCGVSATLWYPSGRMTHAQSSVKPVVSFLL